MQCLPLQSNSCDEHGNALKAATVQDYNRHIRYVNKFKCMTNVINQKADLPPAEPYCSDELSRSLLVVKNYCTDNSDLRWLGT